MERIWGWTHGEQTATNQLYKLLKLPAQVICISVLAIWVELGETGNGVAVTVDLINGFWDSKDFTGLVQVSFDLGVKAVFFKKKYLRGIEIAIIFAI